MVANRARLENLSERRETEVAPAQRCESAALLAWKILGGAVAALAIAALIMSVDDIRRLIRIQRM